MRSLSSLCSTLLSHLPHQEASVSLPPDLQVDQRPSQLMMDMHGMLNQVMRSEWWPRGLGLHVDWERLRHEIEPAEGASSWLQIVRNPEGWGSAADDYGIVGNELGAVLEAVVTELRLHVGSLNPGLLNRLPATVQDMVEHLQADDGRPVQLSHTIVRRPTAGRLSAGEALGPGIPLDAGSAQAEVSRRLGAVLLERFDWSRPVALEPRPFKALEDARKQGGAQARQWSLLVANDRGDIDLLLHDTSGARSLGTVLKAGPHVRGATIFRPQPFDNLEDVAMRAAAFHRATRHPDARFFVPDEGLAAKGKPPLATLDRRGRIVVKAHGQIMRDPTLGERVLKVGERTSDQLARDLIAAGLPRTFAGTVFLESCASLTDALHPTSYAEQLRAALASRGFDRVSVAMRPGASFGTGGRARIVQEERVQAPPVSHGGRLWLPTVREPKRAWYRRPWDGLRRLFGRPAVSSQVRADPVSTQGVSGSDVRSSMDPRGVQRMWGVFGAMKQRR